MKTAKIRKPIQIALLPSDGKTFPQLFALCNDGSIWRLHDPAQEGFQRPTWERLPTFRLEGKP